MGESPTFHFGQSELRPSWQKCHICDKFMSSHITSRRTPGLPPHPRNSCSHPRGGDVRGGVVRRQARSRRGHPAGLSSLSVTHLWLVMVIPPAVRSTMYTVSCVE